MNEGNKRKTRFLVCVRCLGPACTGAGLTSGSSSTLALQAPGSLSGLTDTGASRDFFKVDPGSKRVLSLLLAIAWVSPAAPQALLMVCFMKQSEDLTSCP